MDFSDLVLLFRAIVKEVWLNKFKMVFSGAFVAFVILGIGMATPTAYQTSMTMYVDNQNILGPLLAKQATMTGVQEKVRVVRDVMMSPRILSEALTTIFPDFPQMGPDARQALIVKARADLTISSLSNSYIKIEYSDTNASRTYDFVNALSDIFIKDSSETQRSESRSAFQFIDNQVKQYKSQLVGAEDGLKIFNAASLDGSVSSVEIRLARLREALEELKLEADGYQIQMRSLQNQLSEESRFSAKEYKADVYRERITKLNAQRELLLLSYKETYPDVIAVTLQIEDMQKAIISAAASDDIANSADVGSGLNPLYSELRSKLATAKVALYTTERRLTATNRLVQDEVERRKRIAARDAELSELTRDYTVTKKIYEDMLERKEKARMSMTLSIEGQGITYKVQEPAQYPLTPVGLTFGFFVLAGLVLSILIPIAAIAVYIMVDPRIRFTREFSELNDIPVLAVVPHIPSQFGERVFQKDIILLSLLGLALLAAYISLAFVHRAGIDWSGLI